MDTLPLVVVVLWLSPSLRVEPSLVLRMLPAFRPNRAQACSCETGVGN